MILRLIEEGIAAGIGTIAFALMFHVPKQYYLCGGVAGAAGWLVYRALELNVNSLMGPVFAGAFTVVFLSRIFAVRKKCPVTMFLIPGIFLVATVLCLTNVGNVCREQTNRKESNF